MKRKSPRLNRISINRCGNLVTKFGRGLSRAILSDPYIEFQSPDTPVVDCLKPSEDIQWHLTHGSMSAKHENFDLPIDLTTPNNYTASPSFAKTGNTRLKQTEQISYSIENEHVIRRPSNYIRGLTQAIIVPPAVAGTITTLTYYRVIAGQPTFRVYIETDASTVPSLLEFDLTFIMSIGLPGVITPFNFQNCTATYVGGRTTYGAPRISPVFNFKPNGGTLFASFDFTTLNNATPSGVHVDQIGINRAFMQIGDGDPQNFADRFSQRVIGTFGIDYNKITNLMKYRFRTAPTLNTPVNLIITTAASSVVAPHISTNNCFPNNLNGSTGAFSFGGVNSDTFAAGFTEGSFKFNMSGANDLQYYQIYNIAGGNTLTSNVALIL